MPLYEFKCGGCGTRQQFTDHHTASVQGWASGQVQVNGHLRYFVRCKACGPAPWMTAAMKEAEKDEQQRKK